MGTRRALRTGRPGRPATRAADPAQDNRRQLAVLAGQPPKRLPPPPPPDAPTTAYRLTLGRIAQESYRLAADTVLAEVRRLQEMAEAYREDKDEDERAAEQDHPHTPAEKAELDVPESLDDAVMLLEVRAKAYAASLDTNRITAKHAKQVETFSRGVTLRVLGDLGLNPIPDGSAMAKARDAWVRENADLIVSQPLEVAERCGQVVREMVPGGSRWETIAKRLEEEQGIATRRASLIARDQVSKYNAALTQIQQRGAGIEYYMWQGAMDNRERPSHVALQGTVWSWDRPPPIGSPGEPIQCLPGNSPIHAAPNVSVAYRRRYRGQLTTIIANNRVLLRCTANHPVLTVSGWKPAKDLQIGDKIVNDIASNAAECFGNVQIEDTVPSIEQVFDAFAVIGFAVRNLGSSVDFHGDGTDQDVDVIRLDWSLSDRVIPSFNQQVCDLALQSADMCLPDVAGLHTFRFLLRSLGLTSNRIVRGLSKLLAFVSGHPGMANVHSLAAVSWRASFAQQSIGDRASVESQSLGDALDAFASFVCSEDCRAIDLLGIVCNAMRSGDSESSRTQGLAQVIGIDAEQASNLAQSGAFAEHSLSTIEQIISEDFTGHVYNLETATGWYRSNAIVHNCRCWASPVTSEDAKKFAVQWTPEELAARTADLGPTQREGPDATPEQVAKRAAREVAAEVKLAQRRVP